MSERRQDFFAGSRDARSVRLAETLSPGHVSASGHVSTSWYLGSQGCVTLPLGESSVKFTPVAVKSRLPDPATQPWPMGDVVPEEPLPPEIDAAKLKLAVDGSVT
jgi:hypothetical protein